MEQWMFEALTQRTSGFYGKELEEGEGYDSTKEEEMGVLVPVLLQWEEEEAMS